jgi:hypothetical protein
VVIATLHHGDAADYGAARTSRYADLQTYLNERPAGRGAFVGANLNRTI